MELYASSGMAKQEALGSLWGPGAFPQPTAPNCIGSLLQKALQDPPASLPARALQKEAGEPPPTPFRPLPGKAGEATGNASPRRASQPRGQRTPNPRKAELGGSTTLLNLQGPAGRGPSRPQAGVQSPGCTSWGPGGHQARPSRKPSRGKGAWGGAPGRSWAGGRNRRARGAGGARRAPGSQPPTQPGPSQALSTGVRSPPLPKDHPPPAPRNRNPRRGAGRPSRASWDAHPQPPPSGRTASPGTRGRQKWQPWGLRQDHGAPRFGGGGGRGGRKVPRPHGDGALRNGGSAPSLSGRTCCAESPGRAGFQSEPGACRGWARKHGQPMASTPGLRWPGLRFLWGNMAPSPTTPQTAAPAWRTRVSSASTSEPQRRVEPSRQAASGALGRGLPTGQKGPRPRKPLTSGATSEPRAAPTLQTPEETGAGTQ